MAKKTDTKKPKEPPKAKAQGKAQGKAKTPPPPRDEPFHAPSRRRRAALFVLKWGAVLAVWGIIVVGLVLAWFATDLPDPDDALAATRRPTITVVAADGAVLRAVGDLYGLPVRVDEVPPGLVAAVLSTEDRRFYDHFGVDLLGLARATVSNLRAGRVVQGGSTITQQVAKNLFLTRARTFKRKIQEVMLAIWLERRFTKDEILAMYLNRVYLGAGVYGVDAAARAYFGVPVKRVNLYESALLAGLLKAPSRYNPQASPKLADGRTRQVLRNMVAAGYLSDAEVAAAEKAGRRAVGARASGRVGRYFTDWVLDQVTSFVVPGDRDLTVVTTLDSRLQAQAERAVVDRLSKAKAVRVGQAAAVVLEPDGAVRALVGGRNYVESQFNRVVQARRQPGSAFKPIVFLAGLEAGLSPDDTVEDAPITIGTWSPRNFDGEYHGTVTLTRALADSLNTAAVRVAKRAGPDRVRDTARRLGITADLPADLGLALGTGDLTLLELTAAYGAFANGGVGVWPYAIEEIRDGTGTVVYRRDGSGPGRVVHPDRVRQMNRMLRAVVATGTGQSARLKGRQTAGKTGTSQSYRDAWFIGFTANLIGGVWVGNDDETPMKRVTGGGLPARLWHDIMAAAHQGRRVRELP